MIKQLHAIELSIEQTKVIEDVVLSDLFKLNYALLNKKQGDKIQLFPEIRLEKRKWIHHSCKISILIDQFCYKKGYIINPSNLQEMLSSVSKFLSKELRKSIKQLVYTFVIVQ